MVGSHGDENSCKGALEKSRRWRRQSSLFYVDVWIASAASTHFCVTGLRPERVGFKPCDIGGYLSEQPRRIDQQIKLNLFARHYLGMPS